MNIAWIIGQEIKAGVLDAELLTSIAPSWGSYKTWQEYKTDNCICNVPSECKELVQRDFIKVCNLWVPELFFADLGRPIGLHLFGGEFTNDGYPYKDDLVALHLGSTNADVVLLLGFDFTDITLEHGDARIDRLNYHLNVMRFIKSHPDKQFVLVNNTAEISGMFTELDNLVEDTVDAVKELLYNK